MEWECEWWWYDNEIIYTYRNCLRVTCFRVQMSWSKCNDKKCLIRYWLVIDYVFLMFFLRFIIFVTFDLIQIKYDVMLYLNNEVMTQLHLWINCLKMNISEILPESYQYHFSSIIFCTKLCCLWYGHIRSRITYERIKM